MDIAKILLQINICSTLFMFGLIWIVQVVTYPQFLYVREGFAEYHKRHMYRTTSVVAIPMLLEAFSSVLMLYYPYPGVSLYHIWLGVFLIFVIWISTALFSVSNHGKLEVKFDEPAIKSLVRTNWIRTIAWSLRAGLMIYILNTLF